MNVSVENKRTSCDILLLKKIVNINMENKNINCGLRIIVCNDKVNEDKLKMYS